MAGNGRSRYVEAAGIRTHFLVEGSGPPVVLLHGLGASAVAWRDNIGPLARRFTVYAVDIPGHGRSDKPPGAYTLERGVAFMEGFMEAVGIPSAALVGNSMGGLMALKAAIDLAHRVTRLALVDTAGLGREVSIYLRLASIPLLDPLLEWPSERGTRAMLREVLHDRSLVTPELVRELTESRSSRGARRAVLQMLRHGVGPMGVRPSHVLMEALGRLPIPVLVVWGQRDRIFPVSHAHRVAHRWPGVQVEVFPGCGHWPQMDRAREFNALLTEFLADPGGEAPARGAT